MEPADLEAVSAIAAQSPGEGWGIAAFERELTTTANARYIVAGDGEGSVAGFAGMWLVVDLAHVTNMGVDLARRRRGIGRLLVLGLVEIAARSGMESLTLEVRPSNAAARALYEEFGFYVTGKRKAYYGDTGEDALIMTTEDIASETYRVRLEAIRVRLGKGGGRPPGLLQGADYERWLREPGPPGR